MSRKPKPEKDDAEQSKRFEEVARELGADESDEQFGLAVASVLRPRPKSPPDSSA